MNSDAPPKVEENSTPECVTLVGGGGGGGHGGGASGAWGESKLSDVVKGVAKPKSGSNNGHGPKHLLNGPALIPSGGNSSSAAAAASNSAASVVTQSGAPMAGTTKATSVESQPTPLPNGDLAQSTLALTPPTSPGKKEKPFSGSTVQQANTSKPAKAQTQQQLTHHQQQLKQHPTTGVPSGTSEMTPVKAAVAPVPPPGVSYAKMAEQNKDRLEQMAREVKERELEQERERRRVAQTSKLINSFCPLFLLFCFVIDYFYLIAFLLWFP